MQSVATYAKGRLRENGSEATNRNHRQPLATMVTLDRVGCRRPPANRGDEAVVLVAGTGRAYDDPLA